MSTLYGHFWPEDYKTFFMLNPAEHKICPSTTYISSLTTANSFLLNIAEHVNFSAYKYENVNFVGIFIYISREHFMLS